MKKNVNKIFPAFVADEDKNILVSFASQTLCEEWIKKYGHDDLEIFVHEEPVYMTLETWDNEQKKKIKEALDKKWVILIQCLKI